MAPPNHEMQSSAYDRLYLSLRTMYSSGLGQLVSREQMHGFNAFTGLGVPAFVIATAAWESYVNFTFFSLWTKQFFGSDVYEKMSALADSHDRLSLLDKTFSLPLIAFGRTFKKGDEGFQRLKTMIGVRNAIVHNYMHKSPKGHLEELYRAKVRLPPTPNPTTWTVEISTLESIRWCADSLGILNEELVSLPSDAHQSWKAMFPRFPLSEANAMIKRRFKFS